MFIPSKLFAIRLHALAIVAVGLLSPSVRAGEKKFDSAIERSRRVFRALIEVADIPGLSASVAFDGRIVWSEGFGFADVEKRAAVEPGTRFRTGSIAKPLSAAAIMRLREAGKLDLDAPLARYLPDLSGQIGGATLRQLGGHLAGVRHYTRGDPSDGGYSTHFENSRAALVRFINDPLVSQPGAEYHYSTYGYTLLAAAAEAAADREFSALLTDLVTQPLGLRGTCAASSTPQPPNLATFYQRGQGGKPSVAPATDLSYKVAGGGLVSTSDDLVTFASALFSPGFLKQESLDLLFSEMKTTGGKATTYGFGWGLGRDRADRRHFAHGGGQIGCSTRLVAYPKERLAAAAMCNIEGAPMALGPVLDLFFAALESKPLRAPPADLAGTYDIELRIDDDKLTGELSLARSADDLSGDLTLTKAGESSPSRRARVATAYSTEDGVVDLILVTRDSGAVRFEWKDQAGELEIGGKPRTVTIRRR